VEGYLVMKGVSLKAVQELMGHATIEMTLRYSHLSPGAERCSCSIGMAIPWQRAPPLRQLTDIRGLRAE
jgi:hypothetical protein